MESPLTALLTYIGRSARPLCAVELARELDKPVEVVEGMLATLEGLGKLAARSEVEACRWCPLRSTCDGLPASARFYSNPDALAE